MVLSARMRPRWVRMIWSARARPRPVPSPVFFVVKKGSKMCYIVSLSMPQPVSVTLRQT